MKPEARKDRRSWKKRIDDIRQADFGATTLEQRRQFIDLFRQGEALGIAAKRAGIGIDPALEVLRRNKKKVTVITPPAEVQ